MFLAWVLLSCAVAHAAALSLSDEMASRSLYDLNLPNEKVINVSTTYVGISQPVGVERGMYNGATGLFVSSFVTNKIHFIDTSTGCEDTGTCTIQSVAGSGASGVVNGQFEVATISDPSRMVYLSSLNVLMVTDRGNGLVRYLDFATRNMKTVVTSTGAKVTLLGSAVSDNNPELDIKVNGDYFYLSDSRSVYNMTGTDGTLGGTLTSAKLTKYSALKSWQLANDYDISQQKVFIQGVAINTKASMMYVAYTYARSAIVEVPLRCTSSSEIRVLSSDNVVYDIPRSYPRPRNGMLNSAPIASYALVTFPMHMVYVEADDVLYWVEVHSHMSDNKLGAVAVRRLRFSSSGTGAGGCDCAQLTCNCGEIDYYAGDVGTFRSFLGRSIGYKDGFSDKAKFRVPLTMSVSSDVVGPVIYIADSENSAIRKVRTFVDTPSPTASPTFSHAPSHAPTVSLRPSPSPTISPTSSPTVQPTLFPTLHPVTANPTGSTPTISPSSSSPSLAPTQSPTAGPSSHPTVSHAPTKAHEPSAAPTALNGECLDVILLDEFGDGWLGAALSLNHSGFYQPSDWTNKQVLKPKPKPSVHRVSHHTDPNAFSSSELKLVTSSTNPVQFSICASLDEDRFFERGTYTLEVQSVTGAKIVNDWEMHWQVVKASGESFFGSSKTSMTFDFNDSGEFTLVRSRALSTEKDTCQRCEHPAPKAKPKPNRGVLSERQLSDIKPPPAHTIPFVLHSRSGRGWATSSRRNVGTKYSISDSSKTRLITTGSICEKSLKENCEVKLPDGDYYFRVGGAGDENRGEVAWTFCKVHSDAQSELSFSVVHGECIPGALQQAESMSNAIESTTVTMKGEMLIENVFEDELSVTDLEVFEAGIAESMKISKEDVAVVYVCKTSAGERSFCSEEWGVSDATQTTGSQSQSFGEFEGQGVRKLSETFSYDIVFVVTFVAEKYEVIGTQYQDVLQVSEMLSSALSEDFQSGSLEVAVRGVASTTYQGNALSYVRIVKFVAPVETDLSYKFKSPTQTTLAGVADSLGLAASEVMVIDESLEQESLFLIPLAIIIIAVALLVAITRQRNRSVSASLPKSSASSWRHAVFGAASVDSLAPKCSPSDINIPDADNRVDFDSMFGIRSHNAHNVMESDSCTADLLRSCNSNQPRSNRFVPCENQAPSDDMSKTVDIWGDTEVI
jgi:hypothetical protein